MISTTQFMELDQEAKRALVLDGITSVKAEIFRLTVNMSKLNAWVKELDMMQVDAKYAERFSLLSEQLQINIDSLTEQILIEAQKRRHIAEHIQKIKLSQRLNNPQS